MVENKSIDLWEITQFSVFRNIYIKAGDFRIYVPNTSILRVHVQS